MTRISFDTYYESYIFECSGHTGYSTPGEDILCSAVSVLCYTLDRFLQKLYDEAQIESYTKEFNDGCVIMQFEAFDKSVLDSIEILLDGFRLLSENYPEHIATDF